MFLGYRISGYHGLAESLGMGLTDCCGGVAGKFLWLCGVIREFTAIFHPGSICLENFKESVQGPAVFCVKLSSWLCSWWGMGLKIPVLLYSWGKAWRFSIVLWCNWGLARRGVVGK